MHVCVWQCRTAEAFAALAATRSAQTQPEPQQQEQGQDGSSQAAARVAAASAAAEASALVAAGRREVDLLPHHDNLPATGYALNNADLVRVCVHVCLLD